MEFGLQKPEMMEPPLLVGNPRKRVEAKAYRARDRMGGGWFRHDSESSPSTSPARSPLRAAVGRTHQVQVNPTQICARCSSRKQKQAPKIQQQVVAAGVRTEHFTRGHSPSKVHSPLPESAARLQQQIFANCSSWYRHEHTVIASDAEDEQNEDQHCSPTPAWWHGDQAGGRGAQSSPRSRRVCKEAEDYWKRNHDGSTKDWFRHEHTLLEDKENELADVDEMDACLAAELKENCIVAPADNGCCVCGTSRLDVVD